jgi:hypothetical protein
MSITMNVFLIGSPLQLLNAIEAKHHFGFRNNHLILLTGLGYSGGVATYARLVNSLDWDSVRYVEMQVEFQEWRRGFMGERWSRRVHEYRNMFRQFQNRRILDKLADDFKLAENLIIGNYLECWEQYMRHFPNVLPHQRLYLVDDGTDSLKVNDERLRSSARPMISNVSSGLKSFIKRARQRVRQRFFDWNNREAPKLIFYTAYDLNVRQGDSYVRNEYLLLRKQLSQSAKSNRVMLLGQTLVEEEYLNRQIYYDYLRRVRNYFLEQEVIYVPHPRESPETADFVMNHLKLTILRTSLPIETYLATERVTPVALASFSCSALINCSIIYGKQLPIKAFYIEPRHILKEREVIENIFSYFSTRANESFEIIKLSETVGSN